MGGRKSYNPKNKGKLSYQPILWRKSYKRITFLAETREYVSGQLRNNALITLAPGDRPTGKQIADHLAAVFAAIP